MFWGCKGQVATKNYPHVHDMHELLVCLNHNGYQWINGKKYSFKPGRAFLLLSGTAHFIEASPEAPAEFIFVCFDQLHFINRGQKEIHQILQMLDEKRIYVSSDSEAYQDDAIAQMKVLYEELTGNLVLSQERVNVFLTDLLIKYYRNSGVLGEWGGGGSVVLKEICDMISQNPKKKLSVTMAAKRASMGKTTFSQAFREYTGKTFIEFVQWTRIKHAMELFFMNEYSVSEVAEMIGFENLGYFHRQFKKWTTMTPLAFKKYIKEKGMIPGILKEYYTK